MKKALEFGFLCILALATSSFSLLRNILTLLNSVLELDEGNNLKLCRGGRTKKMMLFQGGRRWVYEFKKWEQEKRE